MNLNIDLSKGIKLIINSFTTLDSYHGPLEDVTKAYQLAFSANPVDFAQPIRRMTLMVFPIFVSVNPMAARILCANSAGYVDRSRFSTINRLEYIQNLTSVLKGLEFRGDISFSQTGYYTNGYTSAPFYYNLLSYDHVTGKHTLEALNPDKGDRILQVSGRDVTGSNQLAYNIKVLHTAAWKDHSTSYIAVLSGQEALNSSPRGVLDGIPQRNLGLSMRLSYGYMDRYYVEV
ncbi:MAG: hypothetical protein ACLUDU_01145 [Butyricimonas faecihominis]